MHDDVMTIIMSQEFGRAEWARLRWHLPTSGAVGWRFHCHMLHEHDAFKKFYVEGWIDFSFWLESPITTLQ